MLKFPHTESFIVVGEEGARVCVVTFLEKSERIAIDVRWKGKMPVDFPSYDKLAEVRILRFLINNGVEINTVTTQDFGNDKEASRKAIDEFLNDNKPFTN